MSLGNPHNVDLVRQLNQQVKDARHAYYALAQPIMTDAEFDVLEAQLKGLVLADPRLAEEAPELYKVGSDVVPSGTEILMDDAGVTPVEDIEVGDVLKAMGSGGRVAHLRPMLSIENNYKKEDVVEWVLALPQGTALCVEPKRDGISCEEKFVNGPLVQAVTRGTGTEGEDMTAQVKALTSVPHFITSIPLLEAAGSDLRVRGELAMRDGELDRINDKAIKTGTKTYASTRNLTAGTMKQKDLTVVASREIILLPWDLYSPTEDDNLPDSNYARMHMLDAAGFEPYGGYFLAGDSTPAQITAAIDKVLADNAKSDIRADGVVIKVDSHKLRKQLGVGSKFTKWMTCFKPQSSSGTTYLRRMVWQVGRTGKFTPVAECDPVVLAGATVTRYGLNNESWIESLGLTIGCKLECIRSGEVIPLITKVIDSTGTPIVYPEYCPECNSSLTIYTEPKSGITTRWCENAECPGRVRDLFSFLGSREILEIDGLAEEMSRKLVTEGYARNVGELFTFQTEVLESYNKLVSEYGEAGEDKFLLAMSKQGFSVTILKMLRSLEKAKRAPWSKWIPALGIPSVSRTLGKVLPKQLQLTAEDMKNLPAKIVLAADMNIENVGPIKSDTMRKWGIKQVNQDICQALYDAGVRPEPLVQSTGGSMEQSLVGVAFVITGEFSETRESITKKLESLGAVSKSGVSKNVTHLIVGSTPGASKLSKYEALAATGINIQKVGQEWLEKTLGEAGLELAGSSFGVEED